MKILQTISILGLTMIISARGGSVDDEVRAPLPANLVALAEKEMHEKAGFDPVTGSLNFAIRAHAIGEFGILDFGNIRIAFRGWEMESEHSSSHSRAFIYPRDQSGFEPRDDVHGGGQEKYTMKTVDEKIEVTFADTSFRMFNSYLDLGLWARGIEYPGGQSMVRFTGERLIVVVNKAKQIEGIYEWPKN